jgi:hypothetical protein
METQVIHSTMDTTRSRMTIRDEGQFQRSQHAGIGSVLLLLW